MRALSAVAGRRHLRAGVDPALAGRARAWRPRRARRHHRDRPATRRRRAARLRRDALPDARPRPSGPGAGRRTSSGGFATPAWNMIFTLLAVGVAVARSGLMFRLVLLSLQRLPPRFIPQSVVLCLTGVLMTAGLASGSTRIALGVPIARGLSDAMGFARAKPRSGGRRAHDVLHVPRDGRAVPDRDVHRPRRARPAPGSRQGPDHLVALVLHRAAALRRDRRRHVPASCSSSSSRNGRGASTWRRCGSSRRSSVP